MYIPFLCPSKRSDICAEIEEDTHNVVLLGMLKCIRLVEQKHVWIGLDNLGTQKEKTTFLLYNGRSFETLNEKKRKQKKKE